MSDPSPPAATVRPGTVLEPAVAALEAALHALRTATSLNADMQQEAVAALTAAHGLLVQQWFGSGAGQDTLFGDGSIPS